MKPHSHHAHQHICLIDWFIFRLTNGYLDKDCEDSHEGGEGIHTGKSQYLIKDVEELLQTLALYQVYILNFISVVSQPYPNSYFHPVVLAFFILFITPSRNNFSILSPPEILI
ncbi:MAG: hypothetical protein HY578_04465 [Nitrospinae bacterium]|nr:hypothetical protein [Nitrospinota bacterium]